MVNKVLKHKFLKYFLFFLLIQNSLFIKSSDIIINEILAANVDINQSQNYEEYADWIELRNISNV